METEELAPLEVAELIDIRPDTNALAPLTAIVPLDCHPAYVYLASLSVGSHRTMTHALNTAADVLSGGRCDLATMPWHLLRYQHTAALRAWLLQNVSASTGNKTLSAVRGALRESWRLGQMTAEQYHRAIDVKPIKDGKPDQAEAGRALDAGEFRALLRACAADPSPAGPRDAAILGLGMLAGLRRAEIAGLQMADYDPTHARLRVVAGKGNKTRIVPVATGLAAALGDWLASRGGTDGPLFAPVRKDGTVQPGGITPAAIYKVLEKRAAEAGVAPFSPHDLRRTFAGDLLDAGADIVTVQKLMGHANANTTAGYDRRTDRTKRDAVSRLHMAWSWKGRG